MPRPRGFARPIRHLAAFDTLGNPAVPTVLLQGETGTGKGLVARVLHDSGPRAQGPFLDVNCAAIPETMLEAELFGFEAGAFTDAKRAKPGLFEAAAGGAGALARAGGARHNSGVGAGGPPRRGLVRSAGGRESGGEAPDDLAGAYTVLGLRPQRSPLTLHGQRPLSRFVGRARECALFAELLGPVAGGRGHVVGLVGEAGVGKSRLAYELVHSPQTRGWRILESVAVSYGTMTPYFPVIDLLRRYAHVEARDDAHTIRAKVTEQVWMLDATLQDTIPALLALLDALPVEHPFLTLDPPQRRRRILDACKQVLLRESQVQPLLLVFEDLHWIDAETQALLDSLVESLPRVRLLVLVTYRPEYQHGGQQNLLHAGTTRSPATGQC